MKRPSQITRLIWDFYRENTSELERLQILKQCKVFRRWGVLHICCWHPEVARSVVALRSLIDEPVAKLRLAQKLKISVENNQFAVFPVGSDKQLA